MNQISDDDAHGMLKITPSSGEIMRLPRVAGKK